MARKHIGISTVPGAAIPTPSGIRQAPTMQQQAHMVAAAAGMHDECMHAAATAATCKHAASTNLAATNANEYSLHTREGACVENAGNSWRLGAMEAAPHPARVGKGHTFYLRCEGDLRGVPMTRCRLLAPRWLKGLEVWKPLCGWPADGKVATLSRASWPAMSSRCTTQASEV
eukprot:364955-Chlamydomonas_euryale.AAC.7